MWKYVIVGFQEEYFKYCFAEKRNDSKYLFLNNSMGNGVVSKIQKICCSEIINKYIRIPLKEIWMNDYTEYGFDKEDKICFVFSKTQSWLLSYKDGKYIKILRGLYPKCKIVIYLADLIATYYEFDIKFFKKVCDYVISYDKNDCLKYKLIHCELPYYRCEILEESEIEEFDVFFCGRAKNRINKIYAIYDYLVENNFTCVFYVTDVKKEYVDKSKNIIYNKKISYEQYLRLLKKSRILIEIIQNNSAGNTLRMKEALSYSKVLVTNNIELNLKERDDQVFIYSNVNQIDIEKLRNGMYKSFLKKDDNDFYIILEKLCN